MEIRSVPIPEPVPPPKELKSGNQPAKTTASSNEGGLTNEDKSGGGSDHDISDDEDVLEGASSISSVNTPEVVMTLTAEDLSELEEPVVGANYLEGTRIAASDADRAKDNEESIVNAQNKNVMDVGAEDGNGNDDVSDIDGETNKQDENDRLSDHNVLEHETAGPEEHEDREEDVNEEDNKNENDVQAASTEAGDEEGTSNEDNQAAEEATVVVDDSGDSAVAESESNSSTNGNEANNADDYMLRNIKR